LFGLIGEGTEFWKDFLRSKVLIVEKSSTSHYRNTCLLKQKQKTRGRRRLSTREEEDPPMGLSHFHYRNDTEPADGPIDPTSEQNHVVTGSPSEPNPKIKGKRSFVPKI